MPGLAAGSCSGTSRRDRAAMKLAVDGRRRQWDPDRLATHVRARPDLPVVGRFALPAHEPAMLSGLFRLYAYVT